MAKCNLYYLLLACPYPTGTPSHPAPLLQTHPLTREERDHSLCRVIIASLLGELLQQLTLETCHHCMEGGEGEGEGGGGGRKGRKGEDSLGHHPGPSSTHTLSVFTHLELKKAAVATVDNCLGALGPRHLQHIHLNEGGGRYWYHHSQRTTPTRHRTPHATPPLTTHQFHFIISHPVTVLT